MSRKFLLRTFRNVAFRKRPYFAHLALTHNCNLRCHFCHIREARLAELDTAGMKRVIDRLDRMGVAVLSITGGEPLLRRDFAELVNYAAEKGLYVKLTSNGTMSQAKYRELLATGVREIGISLDGVEGNQLPYSHCGPKILETLRFLNANLPRGKTVTINVTVSSGNCEQVDGIVAYCTKEFPNLRLWLNPVVVGTGKLRVETEAKVDPDYLYRIESPTLLTPGFYKQACRDYYRGDRYDWGCLAGELFFDIKPNGDLWLCQDLTPAEPLNVLDPEFEQKYQHADFSRRRACAGCTYSCYYVVQKSFEPHYWPEVAASWWKQNTCPDEPCRKTERAHGPLAGFAHFLASRSFASVSRAACAIVCVKPENANTSWTRGPAVSVSPVEGGRP